MRRNAIDTIMKAMVEADATHVAASHHGNFGIHSFSGRHPASGELFQCNGTMHGGWGASLAHDGPGPYKTLSHGDTLDVPVEMQEALYPIRIEAQRIRPDSGGAGEFRGGFGLEKISTFLAPCTSMVASDRSRCPPWGILGGRDGATPDVLVMRPGKAPQRLLKGSVSLATGDQMRILSGGGGGYGDPLKREVALVERDVRLGYVTRKAAAETYGVVLDDEGRALERDTVALRERLAGSTDPLPAAIAKSFPGAMSDNPTRREAFSKQGCEECSLYWRRRGETRAVEN